MPDPVETKKSEHSGAPEPPPFPGAAPPPPVPEPPPAPGGHEPGRSTELPGAHIDQGRGRKFPCEGCGSDLTFHIGQQKLVCGHCGFAKDLELDPEAELAEQDFHAALDRLRLRKPKDEKAEGLKTVRCNSCGAQVEFAGTLKSTHCPYCASPIQINLIRDVDAAAHLPIDGVLPFQVEEKSAQANVNKWIKGLWFAPNDFKKTSVGGRLTGLYTPYYTFDSMTFTRYTGQRGEHYWVTVGSGKNRKRVRKTRWYPASGKFQQFFDDVLVSASTQLPDSTVRKLEPWPLRQAMVFNQQVLAGYLARTHDVELEQGFTAGRERIDAALRQEVCRRIGGDTQRIHSINSRYDAITYKYLLCPVWMYAHRWNAKVFQVVVNACTGEVHGQRPWSFWKIAFTVLGVAAVAGAIALLTNS